MQTPLCRVIGEPKSGLGWVRSAYHPTKSGDGRTYHPTLCASVRGEFASWYRTLVSWRDENIIKMNFTGAVYLCDLVVDVYIFVLSRFREPLGPLGL